MAGLGLAFQIEARRAPGMAAFGRAGKTYGDMEPRRHAVVHEHVPGGMEIHGVEPLAPRIEAEVYVASADHDQGMPPEQQQRLDEALTAAGVRHVCEQYDGAAHGFTMADTAAYDEAATERHWANLMPLLARNLRPA